MKVGPLVFSVEPTQLPWPEVKYRNDGPDWRYLSFALSNMTDIVVAVSVDLSTDPNTWQRRLVNRFDAGWQLLFWPLREPGKRTAKYALRKGTCTGCLDMAEVTACGRCRRGM